MRSQVFLPPKDFQPAKVATISGVGLMLLEVFRFFDLLNRKSIAGVIYEEATDCASQNLRLLSALPANPPNPFYIFWRNETENGILWQRPGRAWRKNP